IAPGHDAPLDELRSLAAEGRRHIASLQSRYVEETSVRTLRIKHNGMLGYFVEMPAREGERFVRPETDSPFIHRQTMANAVRFTTAELSDLAQRIASAGQEAEARQAALLAELAEAARAEARALQAMAEAIAGIDVLAGLAALAETRDFVRPLMSEAPVFHVEGGRHPVVEAALRARGEPFTGNDCRLGGEGEGHLWLVTGPNMAGKSTFLRQNALIVLLAQMGSFVPARAAEIGIVDRLFSRVGAADDIARGRSTFMVEMVETAAILNQASARSFVILDEIGRGTATFDGLSIAWATVEHLHDTLRARTLFATHYHELTGLTARLPGLRAVSMAVKEWRGTLVFLHEVGPGAADRSYGLQVARLAGLPPPVLRRAGAILKELEAQGGPAAMRRLVEELPLFAFAAAQGGEAPPVDGHPVLARLRALEPDTLSPREAQELIYALVALAREEM
ncbi:MAG: DNA mismatch repair protein MutS, partial [Alphaproteobacteria bacterium]|nr:DNA mismatch repair protein MutS [Alphaproteobacteria bacterium]